MIRLLGESCARSALLLLAAAAAQSTWAARFEGMVSAHGSGFLTTYSSSRNFLFGAGGYGRYVHRNFEIEGEIRGSNSPSWPVLGNVRSLLFRVGDGETSEFVFGRLEPKRSYIRNFGLQEGMNHRVCYNAFECAYGGPIGANIRFLDRYELGIQIVTIPDLVPLPGGAGATSGLMPTDRWAAAPVSRFQTLGRSYAYRTTTLMPPTLETLFKPGGWLDIDIIKRNTYRLRWMSSLAMSQRPYPNAATLATLVTGPSGLQEVVGTSRAQNEYPYRHLHTLLGIVDVGGLKLVGEVSLEKIVQGSQSGASRGNAGFFLEPTIRGFLLRGGGGIFRDAQNSFFFQGGAFALVESFKAGVLADYLFNTSSRAFYVRPEIGYVYAKKSEISVAADFIQGDAQTEFYGPLHHNDRISVKLTYAF